MLKSTERPIVIAHARMWVGTPYRHQHMQLQQGVDCVGLIIGAGTAAGVLDISPQEWEPYRGYGRTPNPRKMAKAMRTFLEPLDIAPQPDVLPQDGAVMWLGWRADLPMHLAILATDQRDPERRMMIHAYNGVGRCVEHGFSAEWPARVLSWWNYPGTQEAV